jgi:MFS family permease
VLSRVFNLPKNIWILFVSQPLVMAASPVIVFIGGILSTKMASDPSLATLPITMMILGVASTSIPAALLAKIKGRKFAAITGYITSLIASLTAAFATYIMSFELFVFASLLFGCSAAFIQQLRFAAIENAPSQADIPTVLSILMLSGIFAAFLGPDIALVAKDWIDSPEGYTASFLVLGGLVIVALLILSQFKNIDAETPAVDENTRSLFVIAKQPIFIISVLCAAIGFSLMSYLMTATPLSMHHHHGHSLLDTKWVIQSHIAAMFLPSLITSWLVKRFGLKSLLLAGTVMYGSVAFIAFSGEQVVHYWWALILLGIGWNFLFLTGTTLLPLSYLPSEKHKVQALNDFILFGFQATASLLAGWVLYKAGWHGVVLSSLPFVAILIGITIYFYKNQNKLQQLPKIQLKEQ